MTHRHLIALAATIAVSAPAHAALIGSFESGDLLPWTGVASVRGDLITTHGTHAATIGSGFREGGYIQHTFSTDADVTYRVDLDHGVLVMGTTATREDQITVVGPGNELLLDGSLSSYGAFTAHNAPAYKRYSFAFTAAGGETTMRIQTVGYTPFASTFLDNISITAVTSVPEPASYALMGLGLLAIGIGVRRRQCR